MDHGHEDPKVFRVCDTGGGPLCLLAPISVSSLWLGNSYPLEPTVIASSSEGFP